MKALPASGSARNWPDRETGLLLRAVPRVHARCLVRPVMNHSSEDCQRRSKLTPQRPKRRHGVGFHAAATARSSSSNWRRPGSVMERTEGRLEVTMAITRICEQRETQPPAA